MQYNNNNILNVTYWKNWQWRAKILFHLRGLLRMFFIARLFIKYRTYPLPVKIYGFVSWSISVNNGPHLAYECHNKDSQLPHYVVSCILSLSKLPIKQRIYFDLPSKDNCIFFLVTLIRDNEQEWKLLAFCHFYCLSFWK